MALDNYNDLSQGNNGYQFEYYCTHCNRRWKSEFKANRLGQFTSLLANISEFINGTRQVSNNSHKLSSLRAEGAYKAALEASQEQAAQMYVACGVCDHIVCNNCFNASEQACEPCVQRQNHGDGGRADSAVRGGSGPACPNCSTPNGGGRFCAECGFDMASTHKSCPGCGGMCERSTRFCADCGHGF
jgi:hypothetical protein